MSGMAWVLCGRLHDGVSSRGAMTALRCAHDCGLCISPPCQLCAGVSPWGLSRLRLWRDLHRWHKVNGFTCQRIYWGVTIGRLLFMALVDCAALGFDQLAVVLSGGFSFGHGVGIVCPCLRFGRPFRGLLHLIIGTI